MELETPHENEKLIHVSVPLPESMLRRLKMHAIETDTTQKHVFLEALTRYIETLPPAPVFDDAS